MTLWLGAAIAAAVAFVIGLMIYSIKQDDFNNAPSPDTEQSQPAKPEKPPPLN